MSEMKTVPHDGSVTAFLAGVENNRRRTDAFTALEMMTRVTGEKAVMWGASIVGFGRYGYRRKDGSAHEFMLTGFSPRKAALTIYIMPGFGPYKDQLARLGPHKHSASCLYLTNLEKVDMGALEEMVADSFQVMRDRKAD